MSITLVRRRALLYLRISKDLTRQGIGVERQEVEGRAIADRRDWAIVAVIVDNDTPAKGHDSREGWRRMIAMIKAGEVDVVIGWDMSRVLRNGRDRVDMLELGKAHRITISLMRGQDMDLTHSSGRVVADILGALALQEIELKAERQIAANEHAVSKGLPPTRRAFGYPGLDQRAGRGSTRQVPAEVVAAEADVIRRAYAELLAGESLSGLTRIFAGHTTTRGAEWTRSKIRAALLNPRYGGLRRYKGEIHGKGTWDPIVDETTWRAVQALLKDPDRRTNHRISTARIWLLAGLARCGVCAGNGLDTTVRVNYRGDGDRVYTCRNHAHLGRKAEPIDAWVELVVLEWAATPAAREFLEDRDRPDFEGLKSEAAVLRMRLTQMTEDFTDGVLTREQLRAGTERCRTRIAEIDLALAHVDRAAVIGDLAGPEPESVWRKLSIDRKRKIIDTLMTVTILRGRAGQPGGLRFDPETVRIDWKTGG